MLNAAILIIMREILIYVNSGHKNKIPLPSQVLFTYWVDLNTHMKCISLTTISQLDFSTAYEVISFLSAFSNDCFSLEPFQCSIR